jgi:hypothetical protein
MRTADRQAYMHPAFSARAYFSPPYRRCNPHPVRNAATQEFDSCTSAHDWFFLLFHIQC